MFCLLLLTILVRIIRLPASAEAWIQVREMREYLSFTSSNVSVSVVGVVRGLDARRGCFGCYFSWLGDPLESSHYCSPAEECTHHITTVGFNSHRLNCA